jgi:hypothetical protein
MPRCPSCRESRWVYYQPLPLLSWVTSLTGRKRYECLSCGWRGWRPPRAPAESTPEHAGESTAADHLWDVRRLMGAGALRLQRAAHDIARRWKHVRLPSVRRPPVPAIAVLVLGCALLSMFMLGGRQPDSSQAARGIAAADQPPPVSVEPVKASSVPDNQPFVVPVVQTKIDDALRAAPERVASGFGGSIPVTRTASPAGRSGRIRSARAPRPAEAPARTDPARAPYRGSLAIDSDPQGARVSVGGRVVGSTPMVLQDLPAGSCVVRVEADGYELWSTAARVVANQRTRLTAVLQRGSER